MPLPNETWTMQVKQSLPKPNIKINCAFTISLAKYVKGLSGERNFEVNNYVSLFFRSELWNLNVFDTEISI